VMHFIHITPVLALVLSWLMDGRDIQLRTLDPIRPLFVIAVVLAFTLLGLNKLVEVRSSVRRETRRGTVKVRPAETALEYLETNTRPGEEIFVYPYFPIYYYLTATSNPTPYDYLHPGIHTPEQLQEAVKAIAARRPRVVLFETSFFEDIVIPFPSTPIQVLASRDPVCEFILKEYKPCAALATEDSRHLVFMVRKDHRCPATEAESKENKDP
jgi:hypothetical protein